MLGFADSDSDIVDLGRSDNVSDGVFDCSEIVRETETLVLRTLGAELCGSDTSEPEESAVTDFSGTTNPVDESESRRAGSERSGLGTTEVDGLAGFACPEVTTEVGTTTPPEVVIVGLAATISDERDPSGALDFVTRRDALSPIESEAPSPDCEMLVPPAVLVVP